MTARFLVDENIKRAIVSGLLRQKPELDIVRVQEAGLSGVEDPLILEWAANEGRVLITRDVRTITRFAYERLEAKLSMPGVIEISKNASIGQVIADILILAEFEEELSEQIRYVPL